MPDTEGGISPLLLILTAVSGVVDAVSFLALGHVFVANMTGNIVFVGFAAAGSRDVSLPASLEAIVFFIVGGLAAGRLARFAGPVNTDLVRAAVAVEFLLVAAAAGLSFALPGGGAFRYGLIAPLALALGVQNATARRIAVPDLTTTVLTMTLSGIAADSRLAGGTGKRFGWRLLAVGAMLAGALAGALLVLHVAVFAGLLLAALVLGVVAAAAHRRGTGGEQLGK